MRFFIEDVRDRDGLYHGFAEVSYGYHASATKIAPTAEYKPFAGIKTNINGAMNIINSAIDKGAKRVVARSTDKAHSNRETT